MYALKYSEQDDDGVAMVGGRWCNMHTHKPRTGVSTHHLSARHFNHMCFFVLVALGNADGWSVTPHKAYLFDSNYYTRGNCTLTIEHA